MVSRSEAPKMVTLMPWNPLNQLRALWWLCVHPAGFVAYRGQAGDKATAKPYIWLFSSLVWLPLFIPTLGVALHLARPATDSYGAPVTSPFLTLSGICAVLIAVLWLLTIVFGTLDNRRVQNWNSTNIVGLPGILATAVTPGVVYVAARGVIGAAALIAAFSVMLGLEGALAEDYGGPTILSLNEPFTYMAGAVSGCSSFFGQIFAALSVTSSWVGLVAAFVGIALWVTGIVQIRGPVRKSLLSGQSSVVGKIALVVLVLAYAVLIWIYLLGG